MMLVAFICAVCFLALNSYLVMYNEAQRDLDEAGSIGYNFINRAKFLQLLPRHLARLSQCLTLIVAFPLC